MPDAIQVRDLITFLQTLDPEYRIHVEDRFPLQNAADVFKRSTDHINLVPLEAAKESAREVIETARDSIRDAIKKFEGLTLSELLEGADALQEDISDALNELEDELVG